MTRTTHQKFNAALQNPSGIGPKDIDLAGAKDEQTATADLIAAQAIDLHDHFNFDVTRTPALDQAEAFRAVRYSVTAELAGRRFEQFPVDVALSEHPTTPSERNSRAQGPRT